MIPRVRDQHAGGVALGMPMPSILDLPEGAFGYGRGANKPCSGLSARSAACRHTSLRIPHVRPPVTSLMRQPVTELREATRQRGDTVSGVDDRFGRHHRATRVVVASFGVALPPHTHPPSPAASVGPAEVFTRSWTAVTRGAIQADQSNSSRCSSRIATEFARSLRWRATRSPEQHGIVLDCDA